MTLLTGMFVTLVTDPNEEAHTDDHLYIGIIGTAGGREFPLHTKEGTNDFKSGATEKFGLGAIWDTTIGATIQPLRSAPGEDNDPALIPVELENVNFVYLRKQGDNTLEGDDAYRLKRLTVILYGPAAPSQRIYEFFNGGKSLWLANEHGHVVYLRATRLG